MEVWKRRSRLLWSSRWFWVWPFGASAERKSVAPGASAARAAEPAPPASAGAGRSAAGVSRQNKKYSASGKRVDCLQKNRQWNKAPSCCRIEEVKTTTGGSFYVQIIHTCAGIAAQRIGNEGERVHVSTDCKTIRLSKGTSWGTMQQSAKKAAKNWERLYSSTQGASEKNAGHTGAAAE